MYKRILIILIVLTSLPIVSFAQLGGYPGAFARMGFSARGISMGNAMTAITYGDIVGYYNPALSSFQDDHLINLGYSFLSFDRTLNFVSYTKNFKLPKQSEGGAGITFSWINAGVSNIDGRDNDGYPIGTYSVSENQFLFAPSIRVSEQVSIGFGFKFYYSKLFEGVTSTSLGFDLGALYKVSDKINIGASIKDIKSKYMWNTNSVYGNESGATTEDDFPIVYDIGTSYLLPKEIGVASLEYEGSNKKTNIIKAGVEFVPIKNVALRGGVDRFDLSSNDIFGNSQIMFGVGYQHTINKYVVGLDYSFVVEAYSNKPFQTLTAVFKIK
jgi:hypothetical protein